MEVPLIRIITDGGKNYGIGHLRRSSTLSKALQSRGHLVDLQALSQEGASLIPALEVKNFRPSLIIIDLPYAIDEFPLTPLPSVPVLSLDQFGRFCATITISLRERDLELKGHRLSGLQYAIIREDLIPYRNSNKGEGLLVMIGGGDINGQGWDIAVHFANLGEFVTLVHGPMSQSQTISHRNIISLKNPTNLPERMASCKWALTNAGTTMLEMLYLGKPVHILPQTPDELRFASFVSAHGVLMGIGEKSIYSPSPDQAQILQKKSQELIDGHGIMRIISEIENLLCPV